MSWPRIQSQYQTRLKLKTETEISLNVFTAASPTISPIIDSEQENPFNSKKCLSVFIISHTFCM